MFFSQFPDAVRKIKVILKNNHSISISHKKLDKLLPDLIKKFGNPESNGEKVLDLLMIAKYFERMGDHAVEIAKWVLFSITGRKER